MTFIACKRQSRINPHIHCAACEEFLSLLQSLNSISFGHSYAIKKLLTLKHANPFIRPSIQNTLTYEK